MTTSVVVAGGDLPAEIVDRLADHDIAVTVATGGPEGLAALSGIEPDAIVFVLDGSVEPVAVLGTVRTSPALQSVPVVFVPREATAADVDSMLRLGAHDVIVGPLDEANLLARVTAAARTRHLARELDDLLRTDRLTGLANRSHVSEHLQMMASAARRHRRHLSMLLVDVDHFRRINSDYGHAAGDRVLHEIGRRIEASLRAEDAAGRWGGEEFLVLLPNTDLDGAWTLGDRIRSAVCDEPITTGIGEDVVVTVSVGCAEGAGDNTGDQLTRAEAALAEAKETGRNRVVADTTL